MRTIKPKAQVGRFPALPALMAQALVILAASNAQALETSARQALLIDTTTGTTLLAKDADAMMAPASMTKMMTVYMLFEALKDGRLALDHELPVSKNAWEKGGAASGGSTMFLEPESKVKVEDLIHGIIVQSGNDACIVVAEALAGSEQTFAEQMTEKAKKLGLQNSTFRNATGWPDPEHLTTSRDMALLARRTIEDFPEYYPYYAEKEFTFNGISQQNRNPLLYKDMGADGLKTGHTSVSGYGLTASAQEEGRRLILVVNGLESMRARSEESERLMSWGFREFKPYALFKGGEQVSEAEVWLGQAATVPLVVPDDLAVTLSHQGRKDMQVKVSYNGPVPAPINRGDQVATLSVNAPGIETVEVPLVAGDSVDELGMVGKMAAALQNMIFGSAD
jgi:D-alanyl-D-alanine carboxypeptidase (penicillin-binding protein 5/6)